MKVAENFSACVLRSLLDQVGTEEGRNAACLEGLVASGPSLGGFLVGAQEQAWQTLEIVLAGSNWWAECQGGMDDSARTAIGPSVQAFLDSLTPAGIVPEGETRQQSLQELRAARQAGLLAADPAALQERIRAAGNGEPFPEKTLAAEKMAEELRAAGFAQLASLLGLAGTLLTAAASFFLHRKLASDPALPALLKDPGPVPLPGVSFDGLADVLSRHAELLGMLLAAGPASNPLNIDAETAGHDQGVKSLAQDIIRMLSRHGILDRALRPLDSLALPEEADRLKVQDLLKRFRDLPEGTQGALPAVLHGLGKLEMLVGEFESAHKHFQLVSERVAAAGKAMAHFHTYLAALEHRDWAGALQHLHKAADLDAGQFAPFPLGKYDPERILRTSATGITFLCRNRLSDTNLVVQALWPDGLARDVADIFHDVRGLEELPGVLRLRDCDYADAGRQLPYLVRDHFDGQSLEELVREHGPLSPDDLLRIVKPVAETLCSAHERGTWHRDIKAANLLVRKEGADWKVKLIDFGLGTPSRILSRALGSQSRWGRTAAGSGSASSLACAAPELLGWLESAAPAAGADIYAFGKTCYFALLGTTEPDDEEKGALPLPWRKLLGACTARSLARRMPNFKAVRDKLAAMPAGALNHIVPPGPAASAPLGLGVTPTPSAVPTGSEQVQGFLQRGMVFRQQGDVQHALAAFTKAIQLDPNLTAGYIKRGNMFSELGQLDRAIADYTSAIKVEPNMALAYMNRGLAQAKKGNFEAVIDDCTDALRIDPNLANAYFIRGAAYSSRGERHRAIAEFTLALRIDPRNALAYNDRGMAFAEEGQLDRAIKDYGDAIQIEPRLTPAYLNRGIAFRAKREYERAITEFTKALHLDPRNVLAFLNRGMAHAGRKDFERALADYDKVAQLDPRHPDVARHRQDALQGQSKAAQAKPAGPRVAAPAAQRQAGPSRPTALAPASRPAPAPAGVPGAAGARPVPARAGVGSAPEVRLAPARAGAAAAPPAGTPQAAKPAAPPRPTAEAKQAQARNNAEEERRQVRAAAYFAQGVGHLEEGNYPPAIDNLTKALQIDPKDSLAFYHRGLAHAAQQEYEEALTDYTDSLRLNPKNAMVYYHRGIVFRQRGDLDPAISDFTKAIRIDPNLALAYRSRSQAYSAQGDEARARADLDAAHRLDPNLGK